MKKRRLRIISRILCAACSFVFCAALNAPFASAASLSVEEAVARALEMNTSLQITAIGERTARANLKSSRGSNSPNFRANGSLSLSKNTGETQRRNGSAGASVSMPLFTSGRNEANIAQSKLGVKIAQLDTERAREDTRFAVIKAYYNVLEAEKAVDVSKETVENYHAHLINVEQLYSAGSKAKIDVLRSSVALSNAEQSFIKSQNAYEVSLSKLKNLLLIPHDEELTLTDDFKYVAFNYEMEPCLAYALQNRKDLIADEYDLEQQAYQIKIARAGYGPTLSVSADTDVSSRFAPSPHSSSHGYGASLSASWPLFDNGVTQAAVDRAKAEYDRAALILKRDRDDVDLALQTAYINMREAERRFISTQAAVGEAQEDYYIASEKYRAGEGLMLDILDAQVALSTAQLNYISAQYDYARYRAEVENQMGLGIGETVDEALKR